MTATIFNAILSIIMMLAGLWIKNQLAKFSNLQNELHQAKEKRIGQLEAEVKSLEKKEHQIQVQLQSFVTREALFEALDKMQTSFRGEIRDLRGDLKEYNTSLQEAIKGITDKVFELANRKDKP